MIYKFRLLSSEQEDFICDIELAKNQTFLDFHNIIQKTFNWEDSFLATFYLCNENWEKEQEVSLMDMGSDADQCLLMSDAVLKDFLQTKYERLIYVYDLLNERAYFIELLSALKENPELNYPVCTQIKGKIPPQSSFNDISLE